MELAEIFHIHCCQDKNNYVLKNLHTGNIGGFSQSDRGRSRLGVGMFTETCREIYMVIKVNFKIVKRTL